MYLLQLCCSPVIFVTCFTLKAKNRGGECLEKLGTEGRGERGGLSLFLSWMANTQFNH